MGKVKAYPKAGPEYFVSKKKANKRLGVLQRGGYKVRLYSGDYSSLGYPYKHKIVFRNVK